MTVPFTRNRSGSKRTIIIDFKRFNFLKTHFPKASRKDWKSWQWQIKNSITDLERLDRILMLDPFKKAKLQNINVKFPMRITPYYASLIANLGKNHPLSKTVVPSFRELKVSFGEAADPLHEEDNKKEEMP